MVQSNKPHKQKKTPQIAKSFQRLLFSGFNPNISWSGNIPPGPDTSFSRKD